MSKLEEIKNEIAKKHDYYDWNDMVYSYESQVLLGERVNELMESYATECVKASLEKASKNPTFSTVEIWCGPWDKYVITDFRLNQESITNPDNIVLL